MLMDAQLRGAITSAAIQVRKELGAGLVESTQRVISIFFLSRPFGISG